MELKFFHLAMETGSPAHAMVASKVNERRSVLAGANMPQSHVLQIVSQPVEDRSSTERLSSALDRIMNVTDREKELRDKANTLAGGPGLTDAGDGNCPIWQLLVAFVCVRRPNLRCQTCTFRRQRRRDRRSSRVRNRVHLF
jgi:hypothetical protein